jgi:hypothetical protein
MHGAITEHSFGRHGAMAPCSIRSAAERGLRPAVGFQHPEEVVKDPHLKLHEKRGILSSWASDASAVQDQPSLRWLLGTVEPVLLQDVIASLKRLDGKQAGQAGRAVRTQNARSALNQFPSRKPVESR